MRAERRRLIGAVPAAAALAALGRPVQAASPPNSVQQVRLAQSAEPAASGAEARIARFSAVPPGGPLPSPWRVQTLADVEPNRHALVADGDRTVLQVDSRASASSLVHPLEPAVVPGRLRWRWTADAWPTRGGFGSKPGDDFAARVYLMFDYPVDRVPLAQRMLLGVARAVHGQPVPAAALCYLLDPRAPAETMIDSPYTSRVKMLVVRSSPRTGVWWEEERDVARDFARAFGAEHGPGVAPLRAIAVAADSDQSGARISARFGDLALGDG